MVAASLCFPSCEHRTQSPSCLWLHQPWQRCLASLMHLQFTFFFFFPSIGAEDLNPSLQFKSSHPFICSARANVRALSMQAHTLDSTF